MFRIGRRLNSKCISLRIGYKFFAEVNLLTGAQLLALGESILVLPAHS